MSGRDPRKLLESARVEHERTLAKAASALTQEIAQAVSTQPHLAAEVRDTLTEIAREQPCSAPSRSARSPRSLPPVRALARAT